MRNLIGNELVVDPGYAKDQKPLKGGQVTADKKEDSVDLTISQRKLVS